MGDYDEEADQMRELKELVEQQTRDAAALIEALAGTRGASRRTGYRDYLPIPTIRWNPWRGDRQKNH